MSESRSRKRKRTAKAAPFVPDRPIFTEAGNADRFLRGLGKDYFYCTQRRSWYVWDARHGRWVLDDAQRVLTVMLACVRDLRRELPTLDAKDLAEAARHLQRSETARSLKGALEIAAAACAVAADRLDSNPLLLNVLNGTLDLATGELREPMREDYITKLAPVRFDPDAKSAEVDAFLEHVTQGDAEYRAFLERVLGYLLTGLTDEDKCFLLVGTTRTGKTTFLEMIRSLLGDYACTIPFEALLVRDGGHSGPRPELARCAGARVVTASEVPEGRQFDAATLKALTGGDRITVHGKYERPFEMLPSFKLLMAANVAPKLPRSDDACRERLLILPFARQFEEIDKAMRKRLQSPEARAALLAIAVRGLRELKLRGLGSCEAVEHATKVYWDGSESDAQERALLDRFFSTRIVRDAGAVAASRDLLGDLALLAQELEVRCPTTRRLAEALRVLDFEEHRTATVRGWKGLRLVSRSTPAVTR